MEYIEVFVFAAENLTVSGHERNSTRWEAYVFNLILRVTEKTKKIEKLTMTFCGLDG